ncbi:MAG: gliding motility-associated C-terminal domain-containing protein [Bacteroidia bacterium]
MKNISKLYLILVILLFHLQQLNAFTGTGMPVTEWASPKVFIENRGQFPVTGAKDPKVLYAYDNGSTLIYFKRDGFSYSLLSKTRKEEKGEDEHLRNDKQWLDKEKEEKQAVFKRDDIFITWENSNKTCDVIAQGKVSDYYNYAVQDDAYHQHSIDNIPAFTSLTYKNIYPHIDLVFVFKEEGGIKYLFTVHPGGNPADIKMNYSGMDKLSKNSAGQIIIKTMFGTIIDHAPVTFYEDHTSEIIASEFQKEKNVVSFLTGTYNKARTIVIDPWQLSSGLGFGNSNKVWECEHDNSSNSYFWGGDTPNRLKKYNNAGALQWTYNSPWDTANYWVGSMITDNNGVSYCTGGSNGQISKVNTAGAQVWFNNPNGLFGPIFEYWHLAFNCDQTALVVGGMRAQSPFSPSSYRGVILTINLANGAVTGYTTVGWMAGFNIKEVRSICSAPTGGYYFMTLDSIGYVNAAVVQQWKTTSGYAFGYGIPNYGVTNQGISAIRASANFLYTVNGSTIHKRNITNGAILTTAAIPGGTSTSGFGGNSPGCSGLDIDSCGNVYVGSGNQIVKFDANLVVLSTQTTPSAVYDVSVSKTGQVVGCGNGFMGTYAMGACNPMQSICLTNILTASSSATNVLCNGSCTGTASVTASGGTSPYTYAWLPSGGTGASANNLCAANYTCTITDNVGATTTQSFAITQPTAVAATQSQTNLSCNAVCNGSASVVASGGVPGYTYAWAPSGGNAANATGLCVNTYTCTITDANGCPITKVFSITQPPVITASASSTASGCTTNTGTATTTASGGTGTLTYNWAPSGGTSATANNLAAGNYTCTITDANGCTATTSTTVTTVNGPAATLQSQGNVSCNGGNNGTAAVNATGGTPGYTYAWLPSGGSAATATGLSNGNYTCTITDAAGCTVTQSVAITQPPVITASASSTSSGCTTNTGTATTTASGGNGTLTYSWAPSGGTNATANNLATGTYTCTITDANGCTATAIATVTGAGAPAAALQSQTDALCSGGNTGTATVNATGGTPGYTYAWSPSGGTNATGTAMGAGNYTCTITDAAGCTTTQSVSITEPGAIAASATSTPAGCNTSTGTATAIASGGTGSLTYSWSSGGTAALEPNLAAGIYTVTVTDANGCFTTTTANVSSTGGPLTSVQSAGNVLCNGGSTGSGTVSATGNGPFTYAWSPSGGTAASATGLPAGSYSVSVTDQNGCVTIQNLTITEPAILVSNPSSTTATCGNSNGTADAVASGGTGSYTYAWSNSQTSATLSNLSGGSYSVTVTDANGCTTTSTVVVANTGAPVVNLQSSSNLLCFGGTTGAATVNATGGSAPYTYAWSPTGGTAASASGLSAGSYTVTVTGSDGCVQTQTVTLTQPTAVAVTTNSIPENCGDASGSASAGTSGGSPGYTYLWSNADINDTISNLTAGAYTVTVTDANGCTSGSTVTVINTGSASANAGTSVTIISGQTTQLNGSGGTFYSWTPSATLSCGNCQNPIANPTVTTVYTLMVTDSSGCTAFDTVTVYVDISCGELYFPNAFSPNADGQNDVLYVRGNCIRLLDLQIYNRWGEKVFETTNPASGWDGTWRGIACEAAVFTYVLNATLLDGTEISRKGNVSLVK